MDADELREAHDEARHIWKHVSPNRRKHIDGHNACQLAGMLHYSESENAPFLAYRAELIAELERIASGCPTPATVREKPPRARTTPRPTAPKAQTVEARPTPERTQLNWLDYDAPEGDPLAPLKAMFPDPAKPTGRAKRAHVAETEAAELNRNSRLSKYWRDVRNW